MYDLHILVRIKLFWVGCSVKSNDFITSERLWFTFNRILNYSSLHNCVLSKIGILSGPLSVIISINNWQHLIDFLFCKKIIRK